MNWATANAWAASLDIDGVAGADGWRLPTNTPVNGTSYSTTISSDATTDRGYAPTTTNGTDGGWRDGSGLPVSEMGHMYYVTLGNLGLCDPAVPYCTEQAVWGLSNTGPFANVLSDLYWYGSELSSSSTWLFNSLDGFQGDDLKSFNHYAWAVRSGDVSAVPAPPALWLFGSGLLGLVGVAKSRKSKLSSRGNRSI